MTSVRSHHLVPAQLRPVGVRLALAAAGRAGPRPALPHCLELLRAEAVAPEREGRNGEALAERGGPQGKALAKRGGSQR